MIPQDDMGAGCALLVPFKDDGATGRAENWAWLKRYWMHHLPGAQLVIGTDIDEPFSKTCAINNAFNQADPRHDIIVLLDADCYIAPQVILDCASRIREARDLGERCWFVPYRWLYRLTEEATAKLIASDPIKPVEFVVPHNLDDVTSVTSASYGHHFGALIQIMPREAFIEIGGMDARCRGWGGDDVITLRALDTLYGIHSTTKNEVLTLFHLALGDVFLRRWAGQPATGVNNALSARYIQARRDPKKMQDLVSEWMSDPEYRTHWIDPLPSWWYHHHGHHHHHRHPTCSG